MKEAETQRCREFKGRALAVSLVFLCAAQVLIGTKAEAGRIPALIPMPQAVTEKDGVFTVPERESPVIARTAVPTNEVPPEAYRLSVAADGIRVAASDDAGFFYAEETLKQLAATNAAGGTVYPCVEIEDAPRYRWRGLLVDESRHFFGKKEILSILEHMAEFKLNVLHWHLTDDEGWRLALDRYPRLAVRASWVAKNPFDGKDGGQYGLFFYTRADVAEVLAFAKARHVRVMPEIDIPGHSRALLTAYPELGCAGGGNPREVCPGKDSTLRFIEGVLDEVCALFDSPFIHVGGDECERTGWAKCQDCRNRMEAEGLKDVKELQSWFTRHFTDYLANKGRRLVGWDEILEGGLPAGATVMSWRGAEGGIAAAKAGHDVVMTPNRFCYFDYPQGIPGDTLQYYMWKDPPPVTLAKVYSFDPCAGIPLDRRVHVLGGQGNNWAEFTRTPAELEWKIWPRACALAEALWTAPVVRDDADFAARCAVFRARLLAAGVNSVPLPKRFHRYRKAHPIEVRFGSDA